MSFQFGFVRAPGTWQCPDCLAFNAAASAACPCCAKTKPRFGFAAQQQPSGNPSIPFGSFSQAPFPSWTGGGPNQVTADLNALLQSNDLTDVTFQVDGETINAHKIILAARSEYFRNLLYGEMRESAVENNNGGVVIPVQDVSPGSFRRLLSYLYTGHPGDDMDAHEAAILLACTDFYQLEELKRICEMNLTNALSPGNALELLRQSRIANAESLQKSAMDYIARHKNDTVIKDSIDSLHGEEDGNLLKDLVKHMMKSS